MPTTAETAALKCWVADHEDHSEPIWATSLEKAEEMLKEELDGYLSGYEPLERVPLFDNKDMLTTHDWFAAGYTVPCDNCDERVSIDYDPGVKTAEGRLCIECARVGWIICPVCDDETEVVALASNQCHGCGILAENCDEPGEHEHDGYECMGWVLAETKAQMGARNAQPTLPGIT